MCKHPFYYKMSKQTKSGQRQNFVLYNRFIYKTRRKDFLQIFQNLSVSLLFQSYPMTRKGCQLKYCFIGEKLTLIIQNVNIESNHTMILIIKRPQKLQMKQGMCKSLKCQSLVLNKLTNFMNDH